MATHLAHTFSHVLTQLMSSEDIPLSQLSLLSHHDSTQIQQWNSHLPERLEGRLHDMFRDMVTAQPDAPAIRSWDGSMSYAELDRYSTKLARHLVSLGVGPEVMVPFCFDKSIFTVVSIWATIKAGGANVAISPEYPKARIETILNDIKATVVLFGERCETVMAGFDLKGVTVTKEFLDALPDADTPLPDDVAPRNPAFVVFTSGSTGNPKGIILEHRTLYSSIVAHAKLLNIDSTSAVLQFASYTFDVSMFDMITSVTHGACICIPSDQERLNDLAGAINRLKVNTACLTTTVSTMLDPAEVPGMRHLILLGEAVTKRLVDIWGPARDRVRLTNTYGPAEASILCSATPIVPGAANPSNFGTAVGSRLWIVDQNDHHRLVPVGGVGELLIEGPILARSYLNLPKKTAEAFVEIPFWFDEADGPLRLQRMYRTGDLVRYNSNGTMDFVARRDGQVKVNGQRVELGEIEHHISTEESVAGVVVALAKAGPCKGRLVALVRLKKDITGQDAESTTSIKLLAERDKSHVSEAVDAVRASLSATLPPYMVPTVWAIVEAIPLTATGKTYRAMIAKWIDGMDREIYAQVSGIDEDVSGGATDLTGTEALIQSVWVKVLNLIPEQVGGNTSFLRLGGDSIAAMTAVADLKVAGFTVNVSDLMKGKTIKDLSLMHEQPSSNGSLEQRVTATHLADFSDETRQVFVDMILPSLQKSLGIKNGLQDIEDVFPCSPMQSGILVTQTKTTGSYELHYMMEIRPKIEGRQVDIGRLESAWRMVISRHPSLRTVFIESISQQGLFDQVVLKHADANIQHLTESGETKADMVALLSEHQHMDYQALQIPHRLLVGLSSEGTVLVRLEVSHAIVDGASASVLMRELALAYDDNLPATPAPLYSSFIDHLSSQPTAAHLDFWKTYLTGVEPCQVPHLSDGVRVSERKLAAAPVNVEIPVSALKDFCRENDITLFQVFQAAWALVLRAYANTDDVCFGYVTSGRDAPIDGIQDSVGAFISMLICRMSINDKTSIQSFLKDMQQDFINGLENQHCSLAEIYHALKLSGRSLFNTAIAFQKVSAEGDSFHEGNSIVLEDLGEHDPTEVTKRPLFRPFPQS